MSDSKTVQMARLTLLSANSKFNRTTILTRAIRLYAELQNCVDNGGEVVLKHANKTRSLLLLDKSDAGV